MNEGSRWIRLPIIGMNMQTSELAKLALFMYLARLIGKKQDVIKDFKKGYLPLIAPVGIICLLIAPANLSTALLLGASCMLLLFIGRASTKHLLLTIGAVCVPVLFLIIAAVISHKSAEETTGVKKESTSKLTARVDTWISRVEHFIYGGKDADDDDAYQINQAKIAIAKGGWELVRGIVLREISCHRRITILFIRSSLKNTDWPGARSSSLYTWFFFSGA